LPATWLNLLGTEVESLSDDELLEPLNEVEEEDHLVGSIDSDLALQRLYSLGKRMLGDAQRLLVDARLAKNRAEMEEFVLRAQELSGKGSLVLEIFWASIKDSFQLWGRSSVGIRAGWQVVWSDQDNSMPDIFRHLFGDPPGSS